MLCALRDPAALVATNRTLLESHHVVGVANAPRLTMPLCRNHPAIAHEKLRDAGAEMRPPQSLLEKFIAILYALGAFFMSLGAHCAEWADSLVEFVRALDERSPDWRSMAEARP